MIEDDGNGFDLTAAMERTHGELSMGLHSIRKRAEATNGRLQFESSGQQGTRIGAAWRLAPSGALDTH